MSSLLEIIGRIWQSQLENELVCIKHCWGVYEQKSIVTIVIMSVYFIWSHIKSSLLHFDFFWKPWYLWLIFSDCICLITCKTHSWRTAPEAEIWCAHFCYSISFYYRFTQSIYEYDMLGKEYLLCSLGGTNTSHWDQESLHQLLPMGAYDSFVPSFTVLST